VTASQTLARHKFFPVRGSALSNVPGRGAKVSGGVVGGGPTGGSGSGDAALVDGAVAGAGMPGSASARSHHHSQAGNRNSYAPAHVSAQSARPQSALSRSSRSASSSGDPAAPSSAAVRPLKVVSFNDLPSTRREVLVALHHHPDESRLFSNMWTPASIITAPTNM
jgi:hypothetical protein